MTGAPAPDLPRYRWNKATRAAKITAIRSVGDGFILVLGQVTRNVAVDDSWAGKFKPFIGGYYVVYDDGYTSFSPAPAFEEGYAKIEPEAREPFLGVEDCAAKQSASMAYPVRPGAPPTFECGDVVRLKSGGPRLTVESVYNDRLSVVWMNDGSVARATLSAACLELVSSKNS